MAFKLTNKPDKFRALGSFLDADTTDYINRITAVGGTISSNSISAINQFVKGCKADDIWNSLLDVGVFAGNNLAAALVKLKYPSEVQNALTNFNFVPSDYLEATGLNPGISNSSKYLNTGFNPSLHISNANSCHISFYSRTDSTSTGTEISSGTTSSSRLLIHARYSGTSYFDSYDTGFGRISVLDASSLGLYIGTRISSTSFSLYKNANALVQGSTFGGTLPNASLLLFTLNNSIFSSRICSFYSVGRGLTPAQVTSFYNRVQTLQQSLSRNV